MIGRTLSHYSIEDKIGAGGMGEVYKAHDDRLDRDVALKVLPPGTLSDEHARKRFRKEAQALSKLNHPNIATVHDFDTQDDVDFIVMELVEGASLAEKVKTGPLREDEISDLGAQIADALEEAHERGIVHRDLKPGNISVTPKDRAKVLDFGLAKLMNPVSDEATTEALTEAHAVAGTLPYMAPEELRGARTDHRVDLYSFGVVLYEMATGRRPFEHKLSTALADAIIHEPPEPPSAHNRKVSPGLESIILKALDKDPDHRYQSAREMRVDLERISSPVSVVHPKRKAVRVGRWLWAAAGAVALISAAFLLNVGGLRDRIVGPPDPRIDSIAVLPLDNLSGDPDQDYFADGMTESLITELSKIGSLKVISRTSAMLYKDSEKPLPEIAGELNVEAVVEGSVLRTGDRVRVAAQLVHAATDQYLWAENFDRDLQDILTLYSDVARAIAIEIQIKLTAQEESLLAHAHPVDPEAIEAYLKGNYYSTRYELAAWLRAIDYYEKAIEKDPQYAAPYAALAWYLAVLPIWGGGTAEELYLRAREAAQTAIELDDTLARAHVTLGWIAFSYSWDWAIAEREFRRAIELEPGSADAHRSYGQYLMWMGRSEEGIAEGRQAVELDPLSLPANSNLGQNFYFARRYDEAIEQLTSVLDMEPNYYGAHTWLFFTYVKKELYEDALATCQTMNDLEGFTLVNQFCYAYLYALWGKREEAMRTITSPAWAETLESAWPRAVIYGALGEKDEAFRFLEQALEERDPKLAMAKVDPRLDPLRDDPRFEDFVRRMDFPE